MPMFNKHLLKVLLGFCAMILVGLVSLVIINSLSNDQTTQATVQRPTQGSSPTSVTLPPIKTVCCVKQDKN